MKLWLATCQAKLGSTSAATHLFSGSCKAKKGRLRRVARCLPIKCYFDCFRLKPFDVMLSKSNPVVLFCPNAANVAISR